MRRIRYPSLNRVRVFENGGVEGAARVESRRVPPDMITTTLDVVNPLGKDEKRFVSTFERSPKSQRDVVAADDRSFQSPSRPWRRRPGRRPRSM